MSLVPNPDASALSRHWQRITVDDDVEIAYTERGSGPPVVFVPGWTMSGEVFEHQLTALSSRFRAITFDPRSHGRSTMTEAGNSYLQQGHDLVAFLDALRLTQIHVVAWSYGSLACYAAIEQAGSQRIHSMTVIDETPKPLATGAPGEWAEMDLTEFLDDFVGPVVGEPEAFATEFVAWLVDRPLRPDEQRWLTGMHLATPRHAAATLVISAMLSDYIDLATSLGSTIPFANAVRHDWLEDATPWLSTHMPNAELWTMRCHLGFWDDPDGFNERLVAFLDGA